MWIPICSRCQSDSIRQAAERSERRQVGAVAMIPFGTPDRGTARKALALILTVEAMGIAAIVVAERSAQRADLARISVFQKAGSAWRKRLAEPVHLPTSLAASDAKLAPDEIVIGVEVGGDARAYRLASFEWKSGHIVNDVVGEVPVSVAYCDLTECLRVYSGPPGALPLNLNVAGVLDGEMILRHEGRMYFHKSGNEVEAGAGSPKLPYPLINPTVTTWKEWTARHPDTRVYIGKRENVSRVDRQQSAGPVQ